MKYYYIKKIISEKLGTSRLGISPYNKDFVYDTNIFWEYHKPIKLIIEAIDGEDKFYFAKYAEMDTYILAMTPEFKAVFEQFNIPEHRWYEAEAGYDLEFIQNMKRFFYIEYDVDINVKRPYWVLQFLDRKIEELAFEKIDFKLMDYDTFKPVDNAIYIKKGEITNYQQYKEARKKEVEKKNCFIKPIVYSYAKNYDILWGGINIVFNERVKEALEATNIITAENGLEFVEFTDYEIEMLGG